MARESLVALTAAVNHNDCGIRPTGTPITWLCTWPCTGRANVPAMSAAVYTGRVRDPSTAVYTARVHNCIRALCTAIYTCTRDVYTADTRLCASRVHGRLRAVYTAVYTARIRPCIRVHAYTGCVHGHVTRSCMGQLHGRKRPCTGRVHGRVHVARTWPCNGCVHGGNGPQTAVTCRLGLCTRLCRPTCHVHDGPCTPPCTRPAYTNIYVHSRVWLVCTACVHGCVRDVSAAVYIARTRPCNGGCPTRAVNGS